MRIVDYPRIYAYLHPQTHGRLKALSELMDRSASRILEEAFERYFSALSELHRRGVDTVIHTQHAARAKP